MLVSPLDVARSWPDLMRSQLNLVTLSDPHWK